MTESWVLMQLSWRNCVKGWVEVASLRLGLLLYFISVLMLYIIIIEYNNKNKNLVLKNKLLAL